MMTFAASSQAPELVRAGGVYSPEGAADEPSRMSLVAVLRGGLGNQLFQYAMARSLSMRSGSPLVFDRYSEFLLDRAYRREFALSYISPAPRHASFRHVARWLLMRATVRSARTLLGRSLSFDRLYGGRVLVEPTSSQYKPLPAISPVNWTLFGYWQSPKYFASHEKIIASEISPSPPRTGPFRAVADALRDRNSVAIGLRLYEEAKRPNEHARDGRLKTIPEIGKCVDELRQRYSDARFVLFCSKVPHEMSRFGLPDDTIVATPQTGFGCPISSLWLMSQCRHHIITNSTFYWWGAWLSEWATFDSPGTVFAANNFHNIDALCPHWRPF